MKETSDKLQIESENKMAAESLASQLQSEVKMKVSLIENILFLYICTFMLMQSDTIAELELKMNTLQSNLVTANTTISSQNEVVL